MYDDFEQLFSIYMCEINHGSFIQEIVIYKY